MTQTDSQRGRIAAREIAGGYGTGMYHSIMDFLECEYRDALSCMETADSEAEILRWQGAARAANAMIAKIKAHNREEQ